LLSIQKLIIKIVGVYCRAETEADHLERHICPEAVAQFFFKILDSRGFTFDHEQGQTVHFCEKLKKNMLKLLKAFSQSKQLRTFAFQILFTFIKESIVKLNKPIEMND